MLKLVEEKSRKVDAQKSLESTLTEELESQGALTLGFPGGNARQTVYAAGEGKLWAAFGGPSRDPIPRYWNSFGVFQRNRTSLDITLEINIPIEKNTAQVAGFFAEDTVTGDVFLMHSGGVGGGRKGVSRDAFLAWSKEQLVEVGVSDGSTRTGVAIAKLDSRDLQDRLWAYVKRVQSFKDLVASGGLDREEFREMLRQFRRYSKEFSGKKKGSRTGDFEYISYHGDIVHVLYEELTARIAPNEKVFNSNLIDLLVERDGRLSEVYEVKTTVGRQSLYTAIGQIVTHTAGADGKVSRFLVVPADEAVPEDLLRAIKSLGITLRYFRVKFRRGRSAVVLEANAAG